MYAWRRAVFPAIVVLLALVALGASADAQFSNPLNRLKKKPPAPDTSAVPAPAPKQQGFGAGVTPALVDQFLKALKARVVANEARAAAYERAQVVVRASKATEDRINKARGDRMAAAMEKQGACEDAAREKDPRYKKAIQLNEMSNAAHDKGDQAAGDKYGEQAAALNDELEAMAKKACTGDCSAKTMEKDPRNRELLEKERAAANEKDPNKKAQLTAEAQMLRGTMMVEAEMSCGYMGASKPTAAEQAETDAAAKAAKDAMEKVDAEPLSTGEMTGNDFGKMIELTLGVCGDNAATPATAESKAALKPRCGELTSAMKAAGVS